MAPVNFDCDCSSWLPVNLFIESEVYLIRVHLSQVESIRLKAPEAPLAIECVHISQDLSNLPPKSCEIHLFFYEEEK